MAQNIFGTEVPANLNNNDGDPYTLGTRVQPSVNGQATHGEWYFPTTTPSQPVQMGVYRNSDEVLLGSATFPGGESPGRHQVAFSPAIDLVAGIEYTVVVLTPDRYVSTGGYFGVDKTSGDLYCPTVAGRFNVGPTMTFPTQQFGNANYWPDMIFVPAGSSAEGTVAIGLDYAVSTTGGADAEGVAATSLNLAVAATGSRSSEGSVALSLGLAVAATGERVSQGSNTLGLGLALSVTGASAEAQGSAALGLNFAVAATGSNGESGRPVKPWPFPEGGTSGYPWTPRPVKSFQEVPT